MGNRSWRPDAFQACLDQIIHPASRKADAGIRRAVVDLQLVAAAIYGGPKQGTQSQAALFVMLVWPLPSEFIT